MNTNVKILEKKIHISDRLDVCYGVERAEGFDIFNKRRYKDSAFKPKGKWEKIDDEYFKELLTTDTNVSIHENISLIKLPLKLISLLKEIGYDNCKNGNDYYNISEQKLDLLQKFLLNISVFFSKIVPLNYSISDISLLCVSFENPKIETIAYDIKDSKYFGLHIDNNGRKMDNSYIRPNRLSINLGKEARYLLFVNLTVEGLKQKILDKDITFNLKFKKFTYVDLVETFFILYPNYPILRMRQEPYEAYIAPTDNIIHDGSTLDKTLPDITMVFIGYFNLFY